MRLTIRTNLAMRTLMFCAVNEGRILRRQDVAQACNASENHLAQVIHRLARQGFVRTVRGRSGGLALGRAADAIRVGDVVRAFEASVPFTECMTGGDGACPLVGACRLTCAFADALEAFYASLDRISVADLVKGNIGLQAVLLVA